MNFAIVENGVVTNVAIAEAPLAANWIASETASIGDRFENGVFVPRVQEISTEQLALGARMQRDGLLRAYVDAINPMRWEQMTSEQQDAWRAYRQALLDVPQQAGFPVTIDWPQAPT